MTMHAAIRVQGLEKSLRCWCAWNYANSSTWSFLAQRLDQLRQEGK